MESKAQKADYSVVPDRLFPENKLVGLDCGSVSRERFGEGVQSRELPRSPGIPGEFPGNSPGICN